VGYLDDLTVFGFVIRLVDKDLTSYQEWKIEQESTEEQ